MGSAAAAAEGGKGLSVRDLQRLARAAGPKGPASQRERLSRAARLHLADELSRSGGAGLGLAAGVAVFLAATCGREAPTSTAAFAAMTLAALYACRRLRRAYRTGGKSTSRPFRWRARYTAALSVFSAALGAGAFLLVSGPTLEPLALQVLLLLCVAVFGLGATHASHAASAAAATAPALMFLAPASLVFAPNALTAGLFIAGFALAAVSLTILARRRRRKAAARFPRTSARMRSPEALSWGDDGKRAGASDADRAPDEAARRRA